ncbi:MAG: hypothetical protein E6F98_02985 [Actinobacteria bacterium]|nr:MAG: hypothetical protein E6F98_02985 [Actinomycetota bacterium]
MVKSIVFVASLLAAGMVAVKDGRVLHASGLTGACAVVQTTADGQQWEACSSGKLEGAPDLSRNGCTDTGLYAGRVFWRCPAPVVSAP